MSIAIEALHKSFGAYKALDGVSLEVEGGELVALLGPSGCGKTTLLRIVAGLEAADSGRVLLDGQDTRRLRPGQRNVGFVFQHYALFRHMTVAENVAFGLRVLRGAARPGKAAVAGRVRELLAMVQMDWAADRLPSQLSGGQRQRVALARALAIQPRVLLLDEPFSALDAKVRLELRRWLRRLHDETRITSVFVTHDQDEALELADRVVIVNGGRIEQEGTPEEVYDRPANAFVYNFLGNINTFHCRTRGGRLDPSGPITSRGAARAAPPKDGGEMAQGFLRPHEVRILRARRSPADRAAVVAEVRLIGANADVTLRCEGLEEPVEAEIPRGEWKGLGLAKGDRAYVSLERIAVFPIEYTI